MIKITPKYFRASLFLAIIAGVVLLAGCSVTSPPKAKAALSPQSETGQKPQDSNALGKSEAEGIPPGGAAQTSNSRPPDENDTDNPYPTPPPDPPQTPIRTFYELDGNPPAAPGLAMRKRVFYPEPAKIAYLTIDDGPYPETTPRILRILQEEGVHATFFVVGRQVQHYPELLKAEYDQGNAIGNHSYSHDYGIYRSPETFLADIKKNEDLIFSIIGMRPHIIRAPGGTQGHFHIRYFNATDAADYLVYDWNVSTADAAAPLVPAATLIRNVQNQVPGKDRVIILMHDAGAKTTTVEALPQIIRYLKQQGYAFGVLTPHVAPIVFPGGFHS